MAFSTIPTSPLNPALYSWTQTSQSPLTYRRRALASEAPWISRVKSLHELFVYTSIHIAVPTARAAIRHAVTTAWCQLRFEVPELSCTAAFEDGVPYMTWRALPSLDEEVEDEGIWRGFVPIFANDEMEMGMVMEKVGFKRARGRVLKAKKRELSEEEAMAVLWVNCVGEKRGDCSNGNVMVNQMVSQVEVLLNVDHLVCDGIGVKILMGRFLEIFAVELGRGEDEAQDMIRFVERWRNLAAPWIENMNPEQVLSGEEYEKGCQVNRDLLFNKLAQNPGLPLLRDSCHPDQETYFITLTAAQSTLLTQRVKQLVGQEANITHLGHAAMALATLRSSPPSPGIKAWYSPCWLNGRRYLQPAAQQCISICQSVAPIVFTDIDELYIPKGSTSTEIREMLVKTCKIATVEYGELKRRKSVLPEAIELMEGIGRTIRRNRQEVKQPSNYQSEDPQLLRTADPFFLSDGITERYISHSYPSAPGTMKVFEVDEVTFAAHAEKNLVVRMSSWRGQTTISGEWVGCDFERRTVVEFLEDVSLMTTEQALQMTVEQ